LDPNARLAACRRLAATIIRQADADRQQQKSNDNNMLGEELAENFRNLDEWLTKGGSLPENWRTNA